MIVGKDETFFVHDYARAEAAFGVGAIVRLIEEAIEEILEGIAEFFRGLVAAFGLFDNLRGGDVDDGRAKFFGDGREGVREGDGIGNGEERGAGGGLVVGGLRVAGDYSADHDADGESADDEERGENFAAAHPAEQFLKFNAHSGAPCALRNFDCLDGGEQGPRGLRRNESITRDSSRGCAGSCGFALGGKGGGNSERLPRRRGGRRDGQRQGQRCPPKKKQAAAPSRYKTRLFHEKQIPACGRQASLRPAPAKMRRAGKSAGLRSLREVTQGRRDDTHYFVSRKFEGAGAFGKLEREVERGHFERHPYFGTGATERAGSGSWDGLVLGFGLGAVFGRVQEFRDAQAAGSADALVPGDAVVGDAAGNSINFFLEAPFCLGAGFILTLHFLLPLLECCRH